MTAASASRPTRAPVPSATVAVVRDADPDAEEPGTLQVLMQERSLASDFVGGAWVFPGGKVDPRDHDVDPDRLGPVDLDGVHGRFGATVGSAGRGDTLALLVAAVRETFEEAGVLLATRDGRALDAADLESTAVVAARAGLADRGVDHDWRPFLAAEDLVLDLGALVPLAWFVTPQGVHRRFTTRFFVAVAPPDQRDPAGHDEVEMTGTVWLSPRAALDAAERGERQVIFPTRRVLEALADLPDVAALRDRTAADGFDLRPITPLLRRDAGTMGVQHPDGGPVEHV